MARFMYSATPGDFVIDTVTGKPQPGITVKVYTAQTGGTQVTDLLNAAGSPVVQLTSDSVGWVQFYGPDEFRDDLWLDTGTGSRLLSRAVAKFALDSVVSGLSSSVSALTSGLSGKLDKSLYAGANQILRGTGGSGAVEAISAPSVSGTYLGYDGSTLGWTTPATSTGIAAVNQDTPVGTVAQWIPPLNGVDKKIPDTWLELNGQQVSKTVYPTLFDIYGYSYGGSGDLFQLPDARQRVLVGYDSGVTEVNQFGKPGGSLTQTLTVANLAAHSHDNTHTHEGTTQNPDKLYLQTGNTVMSTAPAAGTDVPVVRATNNSRSTLPIPGNHTHKFETGTPKVTAGSSPVTGTTGSGTAFSILQPYLTVIHIVKARQDARAVGGSSWPIWTRFVNDTLSTTANVTTTGAGTWTIASSALQIALSAAGTAVGKHATAFGGGFGYAIECELNLQATMGGSGDILGFGFENDTTLSTTPATGVSVRVSGASGARTVALFAADASYASVGSIAWGTDWQKLRLVLHGMTAAVYVYSGTSWSLVLRSTAPGTGYGMVVTAAAPAYTYLYAKTSDSLTGQFRNLKSWSLDTGDLP